MASKTKGKGRKAVLIVIGVVAFAGIGTVSAVASRYQPLVAPGISVAGIQVGGLTQDAALSKIAEWWQERSDQTVVLTAKGLTKKPQNLTPRSLGCSLDMEATLAALPIEDFWTNSSRQIQGKPGTRREVEPVLKFDGQAEKSLEQFVKSNLPKLREAKVEFIGGEIVRTPEQTGLDLDKANLTANLKRAILMGTETELPLVGAKQKVPDQELEKIVEVVSTYTSHYSEGNSNRASNIRNAAKRLSGKVLMPGEVFSFNGVLGQRTARNGFKMAGVYNNGKHDTDIGGGICQVSGTLYNATLLANLKIVERSCHTFPVPYLPTGRDATVSFPAPDFSFKNSTDAPIALSAVAGGGTITFRILGRKQPGLEVKLVTAGHASWSRGEKVIVDHSLPPGKRVVEEKGGLGQRISTYRVVLQDGKEVKREDLGVSYYNGGVRIVRVNPATPVPKLQTPTNPPGKPPTETVPPPTDE